MKTEVSRQLVLDYLAAQGRGDGAKLQELLADDVVWQPPGSILETFEGRDAVLAGFAKGGQWFDLATMKVDTRWIVAEGDKVIVRTSNTAKTANGRDYSNEYVWVYLCADGQIVRIEEHTDSLRFKMIALDD